MGSAPQSHQRSRTAAGPEQGGTEEGEGGAGGVQPQGQEHPCSEGLVVPSDGGAEGACSHGEPRCAPCSAPRGCPLPGCTVGPAQRGGCPVPLGRVRGGGTGTAITSTIAHHRCDPFQHLFAHGAAPTPAPHLTLRNKGLKHP